MAHLLEITSAFEFAVLTLTVPGLRLRKYQNPLCFRVSAPFSSSLTAEFRLIQPQHLPKVELSIGGEAKGLQNQSRSVAPCG
jgi:hypothetical protein